jgi:muramoyltetrapeptide carboxypeptidase LdcA involved in peptidoglycan recycling
MKQGDKVALVNCSNGRQESERNSINKLVELLNNIGLIPVMGDCIYARNGIFSGTGSERGKSLMNFYQDPEIKAIYDISGGDLANEVLPYLDYELIAGSNKMFWGYSDLTTVINAIYAKTGKASVLYQIRQLALGHMPIANCHILESSGRLFSFDYEFIQKEYMEGILVGGNIRCLLKLAGTEYFPDMTDKLLLLEAYSGDTGRITSYLNQLQQMGVFRKTAGILLGTFTQLDKEAGAGCIGELVRRYAGEEIPVARTRQIGHGADSRAVIIGERITLGKE